MKLNVLFCMFDILVVSCVLFQSLCCSSALFVGDKVPHVIVSNYELPHCLRSAFSTSWIIPHLLYLRNARAFPLLPAALASVSFGFLVVRVPSPRLLSRNLRDMLLQISHFLLALSISLNLQTYEFSTAHIIVDFNYCCTAIRKVLSIAVRVALHYEKHYL